MNTNTTVILDGPHFRLANDKAKAMGTTPEQYLQTLIDADALCLDDILKGVREGFEPMDDQELDALLDRARKAARSDA